MPNLNTDWILSTESQDEVLKKLNEILDMQFWNSEDLEKFLKKERIHWQHVGLFEYERFISENIRLQMGVWVSFRFGVNQTECLTITKMEFDKLNSDTQNKLLSLGEFVKIVGV